MRCPFYGGGRGVVFVKLTRYAGHVRFEVHFEVRGEHRGHRGDDGGAHLGSAGRVTARSYSAGGADGPLLEAREVAHPEFSGVSIRRQGPCCTFRADVAYPMILDRLARHLLAFGQQTAQVFRAWAMRAFWACS